MSIRAIFDRSCQSYPSEFSSNRCTTSMLNHSFQVTNHRTVTECATAAPWYQKGARCPVIDYGEDNAIIFNKSQLPERYVQHFQQNAGTLALNQKGIRAAVERRIYLFLIHAILCYKMPFQFYAGQTDEQTGKAKNLYLRTADHRHSVLQKREAAHSSTIPTVVAQALNGERFVYLKGSSAYSQQSATIGMNVHVNGADELLDLKTNGLRNKAVQLLNCAASGLNPVEATFKLIKAFCEQTVIAREHLNSTDLRFLVLEKYQQIGLEIQAAAADPIFFDRLLNVVIAREEKNLRQIVYQKRFEMIRLQATIESRIGKRIDDIRKTMIRGKTLAEDMVLAEFADTPQRQAMEKLLGKTAFVFDQKYAEKIENPASNTFPTRIFKSKGGLKSFQTRIQNLRKQYASALLSLKSAILEDFEELEGTKPTYQSALFKEIRTKVRKWTQAKFTQQYYQKTGSKVSQAWVSRMEELARLTKDRAYKAPLTQRRRYISDIEVEKCAKTFGVDPRLFFP